MAKIVMIQLQTAPYCGTAYLHAATKTAGHQFLLIVSTDKKRILEKLSHEKPDLIGFSCLSSFMNDTLDICRSIKKITKTPIILGGPHPTLFPEVIHEKPIDYICRGEGEFALVDLLNAIDQKKPITHIKNLWVKRKKKVFKNPLRPLVYPLDTIPLIDWSCYKNTAVLYGSPTVFLIRGCPFSCNYCFNEQTRELYHGLGPYIRHFSVKRSIQEIQAALQYFPPNPIIFASDSFGIDLPWMNDVFNEYTKITTLPFVMLLRPELTTPACIAILAKYNCCSVSIGVESGSPRVRKQVVERNYTNDYLVTMAESLHAHNIKFKTFNMLGLPTETENEMWETVEMNIRMKTDYPRAAIFTPFPGTKIVDIAKKHGYLDADYDFTNLPETILDRTILKKLNANYVQNMLFFFQTAVKFPKLMPIIKKLVGWKSNILFRLWFYLIYTVLNGLSEKRSLRTYIPYLYANRKYR
ncbi:MAG: radical SAM protein [Microgenomates group bacterium]